MIGCRSCCPASNRPAPLSGGVSAGFGPRLPGLSVRPVRRSRRARKRSSPSGRPMLSAARRRSNRSGSGSLVEQIGEAGKALPDRRQRGEPVVLAA